VKISFQYHSELSFILFLKKKENLKLSAKDFRNRVSANIRLDYNALQTFPRKHS